MLLQCPNPLTALDRQICYPVLTVEVQEIRTGNHRGGRFVLPSCCFHDLLTAPRQELAGMGLAIIGNVCKLMREGEIAEPFRRFELRLVLTLAGGAAPIPMPWPGMPTDNPTLPLDPAALPFETAMFLDDAKKFKRRVDRLALMRGINRVWVPHLRRQLQRAT